jgi:hypothetical protein
MVIVTVDDRQKTTETHEFFFLHSAKSWLILAGYLPTEADDKEFVHVFTRYTARIKVIK